VPLSITLRDSNHARVQYLEDPNQILSQMRRIAEDEERGGHARYPHLHAIDIYGEAVFNHLQLPALMDEMKLVAPRLDNAEAGAAFIAAFSELARLVNEYCWLIYVIGD
jgi:hypothetical protein